MLVERLISNPPSVVQIDEFEGPLSVLLYLLKKNDLDIRLINLRKITEPYLSWVAQFKEEIENKPQQISLIADFLLVAAILLQLKSESLVGLRDAHGDLISEVEREIKKTESSSKNHRDLEEESIDIQDANDLLKRLHKLDTQKKRAEILKNRLRIYYDLFPRPLSTISQKMTLIENYEALTLDMGENGALELASLYLKNKKPKTKNLEIQSTQHHSIEAYARSILPLVSTESPAHFSAVIPNVDEKIPLRERLLFAFLAVLELCRLGFIEFYQSSPYAEIFLYKKKGEVDRHMASLSFDALNNTVENKAEGGLRAASPS